MACELTNPLPTPATRSLTGQPPCLGVQFSGGTIIQATKEPLLHPAMQTPLAHVAIAFEVRVALAVLLCLIVHCITPVGPDPGVGHG